MKPYADFAYYQNEYGGSILTEAEFLPMALRCSVLIDKITFQRATETEEVKLAMCAAAEALYELRSGGSIVSENNDGYAVTYRERSEEEQTLAVLTAARLFLPPALTNRGCWE